MTILLKKRNLRYELKNQPYEFITGFFKRTIFKEHHEEPVWFGLVSEIPVAYFGDNIRKINKGQFKYCEIFKI